MFFTFPFSQTPDWGAMHGLPAAQYSKPFSEYKSSELTSIPCYSKQVLTVPLSLYEQTWKTNAPEITAKLFYSTKFLGAYDVDAWENTGDHRGVDLKEPIGMPVSNTARGVVSVVSKSKRLGNFVTVRNGEGVVTTYGHLSKVSVKVRQRVQPGAIIGEVGNTGENVVGAHLHLEMTKSGTLVNPMDYITTCKK